jgi:hypothetical protein
MLVAKSKKILLVLLVPISFNVQAQKYSEYEVKAAYLEKFTRFVEWPDSAFMKDVGKPFIIGILGETPFNSILKKTYAKQKIKNKQVEIRYVSDLKDIDGCNMLYISHSLYKQIDQITSYIKNRPILTVCDDIRYKNKGIQIILFLEGNHVYFEIEQDAVNQSGLYMNSLLLTMSKTINTEKNN